VLHPIAVVLLGAFLGQHARGQQIQVAGNLLVELDAADPTAGTAVWANTAPQTIGDFVVPEAMGTPILEEIAGVKGVTFNSTDLQDTYQSEVDAPDGLIGADPTRSIEVWAYNPTVADEETLLAWGRRGGPNGTNMSFNYGTNAFFGAIGHWGGDGPDIGWNNAGGAPAASLWHYLAYTYDGETTRVYADGCLVDTANCEANAEFLGLGVINTYGPSKITLAAQLEADGITLNFPLRGTLSLGRVRIHDEVLTPEQVQNNYNVECPIFCPPPGTCACDNCPTADDFHYKGKAKYTRHLKFSGFPPPTGFAAAQPPGATITSDGVFSYPLPNPPPASFNVRVECTNSQGTASFTWKVTLVNPPTRADIAIAGDLLVDLHASDPSAGTSLWLNNGTLADFFEIGDPVLELLGPESTPGISFNAGGLTDDAYECFEDAPAGVIGVDPTRSIEVWAFNPEISEEETLVAWAQRGGPDGSNMSFNYGTHALYGAVGHWGGTGPDIGWNNAGGAPEPGAWHHLVYTYDGTTTRVYADGVQSNSEFLGAGTINTYGGHPMMLAVQIVDASGTIDFGTREGSLSIGQVRVHDGTLSASQVFRNFNAERGLYGVAEASVQPPAFVNAPAADSFCASATTYAFSLQVTGVPPPDLAVVQPAGATIDVTGAFSYTIPQPPPGSFTVEVKATNAADTVSAIWTVSREDLAAGVQVAEELLVSLDVRDPSAGSDVWTNQGTLGDFTKVGLPQIITKGAIRAMSFNEAGRATDAYQSVNDAPDGVVGPDPTRTIEVWAWNDAIDNEETILAWGKRGGPAGTNMSFNYGTNPTFGAVGHWDTPDLGWGTVPEAGKWHHLVYTFDGGTTRVYDNGAQTNSETLGPGVINTFNLTKITLASQIEADGLTLTPNLKGSLALARVRVHDGVLTPCQVQSNYLAEKNDFVPPACPTPGQPDFADTHCKGVNVVETGRPIGPTHQVTATAEDATGDTIFYTFTATNGIETRTVGPVSTNEAFFNLRNKPGPWTYTVTVDDRADCDDLAADATCTFPPTNGTVYHRGDSDNNGQLQLTDAVRILGYLFLGGVAPTCLDAADTDGNNQLQLTDAVRILGFLFLGQVPPVSPGPPPGACGPDNDATHLACDTYTSC
jgi:hypothetical protein